MEEKNDKDRGLFKRPSSPHWWIRYSDKYGRIRRQSTNTTVKELARKILAKKKVLVAENRHLDVKRVPNTTFFELCEQYWQMRGQHMRTKGLKTIIEIWKGGFRNLPLRELSRARVERFLNDHMEKNKLTPAAWNRHMAMLKAMFNYGIRWGLVLENPTAGIVRLRETGARTRFLNQDEVKSLLAAGSARFRPILVTALHTGMRRGEILNLKWADIDFGNRIITVQESKAGRKRMIPMDDTLVETLKALPSRFQKGFVFLSRSKPGHPIDDLNHTFRRVADKATIADVRFHDLRYVLSLFMFLDCICFFGSTSFLF